MSQAVSHPEDVFLVILTPLSGGRILRFFSLHRRAQRDITGRGQNDMRKVNYLSEVHVPA